ncbi:NUDIX hydrolase [Halovulum dunhuangense]|uniref:NUDIX hydrolase n=1 Tax=Halovulum dunhuangense TaxID=1505036 RepID=A0A849L5G1_9RHOB|nr:NUDIX hydrolase [Halovulum dunhuangense]NNU81414.1 NUDIX hydrolase [Halovulum dunhuangense]
MSTQSPHADQPIRDAASLVLLRQMADGPHVLMGQRGAGAVFMASKYVFPGGRVDDADARVPLDPGLDAGVAARLALHSAVSPMALAAAAIRELWEEAGLRLARPGASAATDVPPGWEGFLDAGLVPDASSLSFVFRAITPPGRPRRFDARFFLADAAALLGDPDDFSAADDELSHLHWLPLAQARNLDLPFITRVVLSEVEAHAKAAARSRPVPFFDHTERHSRFRAL